MLGRVGTGSWREVREEAAEAGAWDTDVAVKEGHRCRREWWARLEGSPGGIPGVSTGVLAPALSSKL